MLATTHYSEVKAFATASDAYENACMEFDIRTLSPTYRLIMGIPGVSNAFEISKKLGLDDAVIERAKKHLGEEAVRFEQLLGEASGSGCSRKRRNRRRNGSGAPRSRYATSRTPSCKRRRRKAKKSSTRRNEQALEILKDARDEAERMISELKSLKSARQEDINAARKSLNDRIGETAEKMHSKPKKKGGAKPEEIAVGDTVRLIGPGVQAVVLRAPKDGSVYVQAGAMKMTVAMDDIAPAAPEKRPARIGGFKRSDTTVGLELDLRGMALDEAVLETDKYLDAAFCRGAARLRSSTARAPACCARASAIF